MPSADWPAPAARGPVSATVALPGSKSLTNRYLVLAALADDRSVLRRPLRSRDTLLMADALRALGATITDVPDGAGEPAWRVDPAPVLTGGVDVGCGLAGTVMRFVTPLAALADGPVRLDGDPHARRRPMAAVLHALRALGVRIEEQGEPGCLPVVVHGTGSVRGGEVVVDASASSQFVSALLLAGPRFDEGVTVVHDGAPLPSAPHVEMTVETLRDAGAVVEDAEPDRWRVEPGPLRGLEVTVEPDLSNAGAFLAAPLVTEGRVTVPDWPRHTTQAGDVLRPVLEGFGASVELDRAGLTVTAPPSGPSGHPSLCGIDVDLHEASELTPVVAALCALADGPSRIRGVAHIRGHETDRLAALTRELSAIGADVTETEDGLAFAPVDRRSLRPTTFRTYADHRMVMAGAVVGLAVPGVVVEDVATVGKTLPTFTTMWEAMLVGDPDRTRA